jgi:hypothetical protein
MLTPHTTCAPAALAKLRARTNMPNRTVVAAATDGRWRTTSPRPNLARRSAVRAGVVSNGRRHHTRRHLTFNGTSVLLAPGGSSSGGGMTMSIPTRFRFFHEVILPKPTGGTAATNPTPAMTPTNPGIVSPPKHSVPAPPPAAAPAPVNAALHGHGSASAHHAAVVVGHHAQLKR